MNMKILQTRDTHANALMLWINPKRMLIPSPIVTYTFLSKQRLLTSELLQNSY